MKPEQWQEAWNLYRDGLDAEKAPDEEIAGQVRRLVESEDEAERSIEAEDAGRGYPRTLGRYRVLRKLDEGGMGIVFEAEQDSPKRTVALKVIKAGVAGAEMLRRFEMEAQALARLHHPGIAQIYDAGTAENGFGPQPYFAMELVRGFPLTRHATESRLDTRARIELLARVCDAVHHAHQHGIIHRDLKPGNILVDESGQPKVLDFGVARVADMEPQLTRYTRAGHLIGTLEYMSPEQILKGPLEVDTRSDVYSLGVLLYELLADRQPYDFHGRPLTEVLRTIGDREPAPLSEVNRSYRGDLQTIVSKALDKDPARRYSSAAELAADLRRYLDNQPIAARPATAGYQLRKFAARNKPMVVGAAAVLAALGWGFAARTQQAIRADREAEAARAVNDFLQQDLLSQASAVRQAESGRPDPEMTVREALDRAAARIGGRFGSRPLVEAAIRQTMGETYFSLGRLPESHAQVARALALRRETLGSDDPATMSSLHSLAMVVRAEGGYRESLPLWNEVRARRSRVLGAEHVDTLRSAQGLAASLRGLGRFEESARLQREILEVRMRTLGGRHPDTLRALNDLALVQMKLGRADEAEQTALTVANTRREVLGAEHPDTLMSLHNLALAHVETGQRLRAAAELEEVLVTQRRVLGDRHPSTLFTMANLSPVYLHLGRTAEALRVAEEALAEQRRLRRERHPESLMLRSVLASAYLAAGRRAEAIGLYREVVDLQSVVLGADHPDTRQTRQALHAAGAAEH